MNLQNLKAPTAYGFPSDHLKSIENLDGLKETQKFIQVGDGKKITVDNHLFGVQKGFEQHFKTLELEKEKPSQTFLLKDLLNAMVLLQVNKDSKLTKKEVVINNSDYEGQIVYLNLQVELNSNTETNAYVFELNSTYKAKPSETTKSNYKYCSLQGGKDSAQTLPLLQGWYQVQNGILYKL